MPADSEDAVLPPKTGPRAAPALARGAPGRSRAGRLARAHPALAAWAAIFAAFGLAAAAQGLIAPHYRWEPERYQRWLARRGALAVKATLGEIGPSARIPSVRAESMGDWIGGTYNPSSFEVTFNSDHQWPDFFLLETAAHECVHAIILQNNLQPPTTTHGDYFLMVNETAASVLGAFITGTTYSRPGVDGSIVTEVLFQFHRSQCDPADPEGEFTAYLTPGRVASGDFDHWTWYAELVHFGAPLPLVDAIYRGSSPSASCARTSTPGTRRSSRSSSAPVGAGTKRTEQGSAGSRRGRSCAGQSELSARGATGIRTSLRRMNQGVKGGL